MALKFYTDTHVAKAVAVQLRSSGVDVVRCEEIGLAEAKDITHLERATAEQRVVITFDKDFARLDNRWKREGKKHGGIFLCQPHLQGEEGIGKIVEFCLTYHQLIANGAGTYADDLEDHLVYLS